VSRSIELIQEIIGRNFHRLLFKNRSFKVKKVVRSSSSRPGSEFGRRRLTSQFRLTSKIRFFWSRAPEMIGREKWYLWRSLVANDEHFDLVSYLVVF